MTRLVWDQLGERIYETGIDRGVFYLGTEGVVWNGLTSVDEDLGDEVTVPLYVDGIKFMDFPQNSDYKATLTALTYPIEFLECEGVLTVDGMLVDGQIPRPFGLSYRTLIGNDIEGAEGEYLIHIIYNLTAVASTKDYQTKTETIGNIEFSWDLTSTPEVVSTGYRPTAHIIVHSSLVHPLLLADIEDFLYGTPLLPPGLPPMSDLVEFISTWTLFRITDNGDGTWTAEDQDQMITMLDPTTFEINADYARYLDPDTYLLSDFPLPP